MIILVTTVPVAIYVKSKYKNSTYSNYCRKRTFFTYLSVIYVISADLDEKSEGGGGNQELFFAMYACVGLWAQFFLILYSATELSNIMRFATRFVFLHVLIVISFFSYQTIYFRSAEEIFSLFMALAFIVESFKALHSSKSNVLYSKVKIKQITILLICLLFGFTK